MSVSIFLDKLKKKHHIFNLTNLGLFPISQTIKRFVQYVDCNKGRLDKQCNLDILWKLSVFCVL